MNKAYSIIEHIWNCRLNGSSLDFEKEILGLLLQQGIKIRQDDGELKQINISMPTSIQYAFVIGLRYIKKDGTQTEDHFLCRRDIGPDAMRLEIEPHYKKRLEFRLPEYRGTHKQQVSFATRNADIGYATHVNTISFYKTNK